ncbi:hypothetical protein RMCBS344292_01187 [Rhizopus microsporus]|nr:hypothetical protein RMCBS344292_01187 [Rhizopus microsporus]
MSRMHALLGYCFQNCCERERRQDQLWIQSNEINNVVFEFKQLLVLPAAINAVPVYQDTVSGTVIAFEVPEAPTPACAVGIQTGNFTTIGTPIVSPESSTSRVSLRI